MTPARPHFTLEDPFRRAIGARAEEYFRSARLPRRDSPALYLKAAFILGWFAASYLLLVFGQFGWMANLTFAVSLALAVCAIGFNIQHDANHGSFSKSRRVNRALGFTLDLVGGSSYLWRFKHNVIHHSFSNIVGVDTDISAEPLLRMAPGQTRRPAHRFQAFYVWALYALLPMGWELMDDWVALARGRISNQSFPKVPRKDVAWIVAWKVFFYGYALVLPMTIHPAGWVLFYFVFVNAVLGIVLSATFQLAHCVGEVEFPEQTATGVMTLGWAEHQVRTTANFAQGNRLITWYVGGLNYQIEHHLFPKVSHVHYPALSKIVEQTCREFGVPYHSAPTVSGALASHLRLLNTLGRPAPAGR